MSIIAVEGLNLKISLYQVNKMLAKSIWGQFEALNFVAPEHTPFKTCYIQLSDTLDPVEVIERINTMAHGKRKNVLKAYVPDTVPFKALSVKSKNKQRVSQVELTAAHVVSVAHQEIMTELQYRYTGLYNLSSKGSHTLLEAIGMTIHDRLKQLVGGEEEASLTPFVLTGRYRKAHPHFGDFQLIVGTLHKLEDAAGAPRTQLQEQELTELPKDLTVVDNIPYTKAQEAITKYTDRILKKLEEHVGGYDLSESVEDSPQEAARKKVQAQVAKMMPYMPSIMKQVVLNHFAEDNKRNKFHKMRMYGEPYLPGKELTQPLMRRLAAQRVSRWKTMFNLLVFELPLERYAKVVALDGTSLGGSKIIIRSSRANIYRVQLSKNTPQPADEDEEIDYTMD